MPSRHTRKTSPSTSKTGRCTRCRIARLLIQHLEHHGVDWGAGESSLLGLCETQWLDVKGGPYQLANPRSVEELAKDVAAFANGGGGLIVIGIATRLEHDEERRGRPGRSERGPGVVAAAPAQ
ncbi:RNA-binding domain-containing protein [Streptomyces sp. NPDC058662]|uniref:RNA-binding domain-containing protein n=1 Tax=Streptomyces sp. NPDC058662 TaxID=3346583 RepID=UPI003669638C